MTTILAIGNSSDYESYLKFIKQNVVSAKYGKLLPDIKGNVIAILFFPEWYWNNYIETPKYRGIYGNKKFFDKLRNYLEFYQKKLEKKYKNIKYVVHPSKLYFDRDKEYIKELLIKNKITVPKSYFTRSIKKIKELSQKKNIFIKVRYGGMGKGITYISKNKILTNFRFKSGRIISRKSDHGWSFKESNDKFLSELLKNDIIIEDAIEPYLINERKFDLRFYISYGKICYIYPRSNDAENVVTNISQGGKGETQNYLKKIPKHLMKKAEIQAIKAAKAYNVNFTSVDVLLSKDKAYVIELNVFPGFPRSKLFNLAKRLIKNIRNKDL